MSVALIAVLLITMFGGSYARANGTPNPTRTFVEFHKYGVNGVDGLDVAYSVAARTFDRGLSVRSSNGWSIPLGFG